jgi:hypothetical protein
MCFLNLSPNSAWYVSHSKEFSNILSHIYICFHVKYPLFLSHCNETSGFLIHFRKSLKYQILRKICPVRAELFHAGRRVGGRTDRQTDMTKLIVAFRNFSNAPQCQGLYTRTLSELLFFCMLSRKPITYGVLIQMWIEIKSVAWPQKVINLMWFWPCIVDNMWK